MSDINIIIIVKSKNQMSPNYKITSSEQAEMWEAIKGDQKSETELKNLRSRVQCGFSSSDNYPRVSTDDFCRIDLHC